MDIIDAFFEWYLIIGVVSAISFIFLLIGYGIGFVAWNGVLGMPETSLSQEGAFARLAKPLKYAGNTFLFWVMIGTPYWYHRLNEMPITPKIVYTQLLIGIIGAVTLILFLAALILIIMDYVKARQASGDGITPYPIKRLLWYWLFYFLVACFLWGILAIPFFVRCSIPH